MNEDLTILEVLKKKNDLEGEIEQLINKFHQETGFMLFDIRIINTDITDFESTNSKYIAQIETDIQI